MRPGTRRSLLAVCLLLVPWLLGLERPPGLASVRDVRTWSYDDFTRVVIEADAPIAPSDVGLVRLARDPVAGRPERLYLDLPRAWVGLRYADGIPVRDGLLQGVRLGQNTLRTTRLVLDLERVEFHRLLTLQNPPRVVVDVHGKRPRHVADGSGRLSAGLRPVQTVVVDAGHGGRDPGALGHGGRLEKEVNLTIALRLAESLRARGFDVVMTRETDRTLDLEERTAIAESARGDVFLSIHANAARRKGARGIETYFLDANHQRHNLSLAARENGVALGKLDALQRALAELRAGETARHSRSLADLVHRGVVGAARRHDRRLPDLGLKSGPFYVLFLSSMPSVLIETGFLTNPKDAKLLSRSSYQEALAEEIAGAVGHYRNRVELDLARLEPAGEESSR